MKERINEIGAFCETYGNSIPNRILEYLMENEDLDFAIGDMAKELQISKPKAYEIIGEFEKKGYLRKSKIVGKTQLYMLNKENSRVKLFLNDFKECLRLVVEENSEESLCESPNTCKEGEYLLARVFVGNIDVTQKLYGGARMKEFPYTIEEMAFLIEEMPQKMFDRVIGRYW